MKDNYKGDPLSALLLMPIEKRIDAVKSDIKSGRHYFKSIASVKLAEALGVPMSSINGDSPDDWYDWGTYFYVEVEAIKEHLKTWSIEELLEFIEDKMPYQRYISLTKMIGDKVSTSTIVKLLSPEECNIISRTIARDKLYSDEDFEVCVTYCVGETLRFEALLNGDYGSISDFKTPYDYWDGNFLNLDNRDQYMFRFMNDEEHNSCDI